MDPTTPTYTRPPLENPDMLPRALLLAGGLVLPLGFAEGLASPAFTPAILTARGLTAATFLAAGAFLPRLSSYRSRAAVTRTVILLAIFASIPVIAWTGGTAGPTLWLLAGLPLTVALVLCDRASIAAVAVAVGLVNVTGIHFAGEWIAPSPWMLNLAFTTVTAIWSSSAWTKVVDANAVVVDENLAAVERRAEVERLHAHEERLATVGRMVGGLAHEINNPLAVVRANLDFLSADLAGNAPPMHRDEKAELVSDARDSAVRIQRLVKDMQQFTRPGERTSRASVVEVVEASVRLARAKAAAAVDIHVQTDGSSPEAVIGGQRLEQALVNVLLNAIDAVERAKPAMPSVEVEVRREGAEVHIRVTDNGAGIPEEDLPHLFEPFFTTKDPGQGTGLGLAIAREYVAQSGGRITAANAPGGGAVLEIALPAPVAVVATLPVARYVSAS